MALASMKDNLHLTLAQINPTVGDIDGNTKKIIASALTARDQQQADIVVFPELALTGYPLEDLLLRQELFDKIKTALKIISRQVKNIHIVLGLPTKIKDQCFNSAIVIYNGRILASTHKQQLQPHGAFDEKHYFIAGTKAGVFNLRGIKTIVTIGEDWREPQTTLAIKKVSAQLIINISAVPFDMIRPYQQEKNIACQARINQIPMVHVNAVGAEAELAFYGGSLVVNSRGMFTLRAPLFDEALIPVTMTFTSKELTPVCNKMLSSLASTTELIYQALVLGVRDYVRKNNFAQAIIGLSGGIDSALTLAIAVDALGKDRVRTFYLPSRYSSNLSAKIAAEAAKILGVKHATISIEPAFKAFLSSFSKKEVKTFKSITLQNIQARCRGVILMAWSNNTNAIVLATGNKSEAAVGYATLYGDMVGGFSVLKDVPKTLVYKLATYRNQISVAIPQAAITRAPTAELTKNQKDANDLPPYPILDEIIKRYVELNQPPRKIITAGFKEELVRKIIKMIDRSEYKRRQAPPGIKITTRAFGYERHYPITAVVL